MGWCKVYRYTFWGSVRSYGIANICEPMNKQPNHGTTIKPAFYTTSCNIQTKLTAQLRRLLRGGQQFGTERLFVAVWIDIPNVSDVAISGRLLTETMES